MSLPATTKRKLTDKQERFLDELLSNGGHVKNAVAAAGYKEQSRSWLTRSLRDEIIERTRSMLATNSVKAANRIIEGLDADGTVPLNQMDMRLKTAESVLDRVGLGKKQQLEVEGQVMHGIVMLPSKDKPKEIIIEQEAE
jgi:phage terminase small subunit|tara:strand:- start:177 stop:596 length:420 start_codon:yes stop_codon:yes gene_type:complete